VSLLVLCRGVRHSQLSFAASSLWPPMLRSSLPGVAAPGRRCGVGRPEGELAIATPTLAWRRSLLTIPHQFAFSFWPRGGARTRASPPALAMASLSTAGASGVAQEPVPGPAQTPVPPQVRMFVANLECSGFASTSLSRRNGPGEPWKWRCIGLRRFLPGGVEKCGC
jgi:hypothetical protein